MNSVARTIWSEMLWFQYLFEGFPGDIYHDKALVVNKDTGKTYL